MAKKKVGDLIREARTNAGLTQEQLARSVEGVSASDIGRAERGEKALTQAALKQIAKATGVTQKSLLEAPAGSGAADRKAAAAKKETATAAKKPATTAKKETATTAKKPATTVKKPASGGASVKLTAAEKRIVELYRKADADTKKEVEALLKGEKDDGGLVESLLGGAVDLLSSLGK